MSAAIAPEEIVDIARIRELRLKRGLTFAAAAKAAGFASRASWYQVESGRKGNITVNTLAAVAAALGVAPQSLLTRKAK